MNFNVFTDLIAERSNTRASMRSRTSQIRDAVRNALVTNYGFPEGSITNGDESISAFSILFAFDQVPQPFPVQAIIETDGEGMLHAKAHKYETPKSHPIPERLAKFSQDIAWIVMQDLRDQIEASLPYREIV